MSERFIVLDVGFDFMVRDTVTGDDLVDADGVVDVLNDYEKENKQLKHDATVLINANKEYRKEIEDMKKTKEENEQLKKEILWWKYRCGEDISGDVE